MYSILYNSQTNRDRDTILSHVYAVRKHLSNALFGSKPSTYNSRSYSTGSKISIYSLSIYMKNLLPTL